MSPEWSFVWVSWTQGVRKPGTHGAPVRVLGLKEQSSAGAQAACSARAQLFPALSPAHTGFHQRVLVAAAFLGPGDSPAQPRADVWPLLPALSWCQGHGSGARFLERRWQVLLENDELCLTPSALRRWRGQAQSRGRRTAAPSRGVRGTATEMEFLLLTVIKEVTVH